MRLATIALLAAVSCYGAEEPSSASFKGILPVLRHPRWHGLPFGWRFSAARR